jgi:hypothetical protein
VTGLVTHFTMHGFTQTLADTANNIGSLTAQGTALIADNAPKLMIGKIIQMASGAITTFAGGAGGLFGLNKLSQGLSKRRGEAAASRFGKMQNQTLWDNNNAAGRFMNKAATWTTDPLNNAAYYGRKIPGLRRRGNKVATHIEHIRAKQSAELFKELNEAGYNDKAYRTLSGAHDSLSEGVKAKMVEGGLKVGEAPRSLRQLEVMANALATGNDTATCRNRYSW